MNEHTVKSPVPGVFYRSPAPGQPRYVEEGGEVEQATTIGLVEIMKQFTEIKAGVAGTLVAFVVPDNATLNPGDAIATIDVR